MSMGQSSCKKRTIFPRKQKDFQGFSDKTIGFPPKVIFPSEMFMDYVEVPFLLHYVLWFSRCRLAVSSSLDFVCVAYAESLFFKFLWPSSLVRNVIAL